MVPRSWGSGGPRRPRCGRRRRRARRPGGGRRWPARPPGRTARRRSGRRPRRRPRSRVAGDAPRRRRRRRRGRARRARGAVAGLVDLDVEADARPTSWPETRMREPARAGRAPASSRSNGTGDQRRQASVSVSTSSTTSGSASTCLWAVHVLMAGTIAARRRVSSAALPICGGAGNDLASSFGMTPAIVSREDEARAARVTMGRMAACADPLARLRALPPRRLDALIALAVLVEGCVEVLLGARSRAATARAPRSCATPRRRPVAAPLLRRPPSRRRARRMSCVADLIGPDLVDHVAARSSPSCSSPSRRATCSRAAARRGRPLGAGARAAARACDRRLPERRRAFVFSITFSRSARRCCSAS